MNAGLSTEALAAQLLIEATNDFNDDPLEKFIGAFNSQGSDWADQHDKHIAQAAMEASNNNENSNT